MSRASIVIITTPRLCCVSRNCRNVARRIPLQQSIWPPHLRCLHCFFVEYTNGIRAQNGVPNQRLDTNPESACSSCRAFACLRTNPEVILTKKKKTVQQLRHILSHAGLLCRTAEVLYFASVDVAWPSEYLFCTIYAHTQTRTHAYTCTYRPKCMNTHWHARCAGV